MSSNFSIFCYFHYRLSTNGAQEFGIDRLKDLPKPASTTTPKSSLAQAKLNKILNDSAVQKLQTNIFAWVDLYNKKVYLFSRKTPDDTWNNQKSLSANPGFKRYNKALKQRVSITPTGNYLIQDQGKFRISDVYNNDPMLFYSRLWDPSQKPSSNESGIFFMLESSTIPDLMDV